MSFYMDTPKLTLITKKDSKDIKQLELGKSYVIGRTDQSDIILKNDYISRTHVEIFSDKGAFWIKDLGSKNGTFIDSKKVSEYPQELKNRTRIELGKGKNKTVLMFIEEDGTLDDTFEDSFEDSFTGTHIVKHFSLDSDSRDVYVNGKLLPVLPKREFDIFELLYQNEGKVCKKDDIAKKGWPDREEGDVSDGEIHQYIKLIRQLLAKYLDQPFNEDIKKYIVTFKSVGYRFNNREI